MNLFAAGVCLVEKGNEYFLEFPEDKLSRADLIAPCYSTPILNYIKETVVLTGGAGGLSNS